RHHRKPLPFRRELGQPPYAFEPRLLSLRAHDVPARGAPVRARLGVEEVPRRGLRSELRRVRLVEGLGALFVRVNTDAVLAARLVRAETGGAHPALPHQRLDAPHVDRAPDAPRLPRREADRVALVVDALPQPVDPAEAERLVDRLR